ncbi:MAG TPA: archaellin/type IV pilin N-terminal domain-containing protein [Thermoplasmata archaeon]|nr:archaellin/type IV pilin N-terminal domain-containing protein [Thermoplasmata archaeon]
MRHLRRNDRGLAEIVGTLMLVLIVVAAVVTFGAFVASYEQQEIAQQAYQHEKALESLRVVSISPGGRLIAAGDRYPSINITVASTDPNPTTITGIVLNGYAVTEDYFQFPGQSTWQLGGLVNGASNITLATDGAATINVTFPGSFGSTFFNLTANSYIDVSFYTVYDNDFVFTFIPPVPVINVDTVPLGQSGGYTNALDGVSSFQPGGNATIVSWAWSGSLVITNCTTTGGVSTCTPSPSLSLSTSFLPTNPTIGAEVQTIIALSGNPFAYTTAPNYVNYTIDLTVTNSDGLEGTGSVVYTPG